MAVKKTTTKAEETAKTAEDKVAQERADKAEENRIKREEAMQAQAKEQALLQEATSIVMDDRCSAEVLLVKNLEADLTLLDIELDKLEGLPFSETVVEEIYETHRNISEINSVIASITSRLQKKQAMVLKELKRVV